MSNFELEQDFDLDELDLEAIPLPSEGTHEATIAGLRVVRSGEHQTQKVVAEIRIEWENDLGETLSHVETKWFDIEKARTASDTLRDRKEFARMCGGKVVTVDDRQKFEDIGQISDHIGKTLVLKVSRGKSGERVFLKDMRPKVKEEE